MPMYKFTLVSDHGNTVMDQTQEIIDDDSAEHECYDGMDPLELARAGKKISWVHCHKVAPEEDA